MRNTTSVFGDVSVFAKCFWVFILPVLDYCSPVWVSAATSHLLLLDRVGRVSQLGGGSVSCDLLHRRKVAFLCVFFKIDIFVGHAVCTLFPALYVMRLFTLNLFRSQGVELGSFRALFFCLVFDCIMGCRNLSLLVKVWVLLRLQSIAFFYRIDCPLFLPAFRLFLFHLSFFRDLR